MDIHAEIIYITIAGGLFSALFVRLLNFLVKSRCQRIRCCWGGLECTRVVVSETNLDKSIVRDIKDIEIPNHLVNFKK